MVAHFYSRDQMHSECDRNLVKILPQIQKKFNISFLTIYVPTAYTLFFKKKPVPLNFGLKIAVPSFLTILASFVLKILEHCCYLRLLRTCL